MPIEHNTLLSHVPRFLAIQARKRALRWLLRWERMQDIYTPVELQVVQPVLPARVFALPVIPIRTERWVCASTASCASCATTLTILYYSLLNSK